MTELSPQLPPLAEQDYAAEQLLSPYARIRLGGDELAICGDITLNPDDPNAERIFVLDVGFQTTEDGKYGPYDIDGSGNKQTFDKPYVLLRQTTTEQGTETHTFNFNAGERVELGRGEQPGDGPVAEQLGYSHNKYISRTHASVEADEYGLIRVLDTSANGTRARTGQEILPGAGTANYGYTLKIDDYVHRAGKKMDKRGGWGAGKFEGRNVIARDTPINTGVYPVGGPNGESLVVDDTKYPEPLNEYFEKITAEIATITPDNVSLKGLKGIMARRRGEAAPASGNFDKAALEKVFGVVSEVLRYDLEATNALADGYKKIAINEYMFEGVGVCRTQALLSAYYVERLINDGTLKGKVSIDRNMDEFEGAPAGHAWARYTAENGDVFVIDPAQKFVGTLQEAMARNQTWDYRRTEDLMRGLLQEAA